MVNHNQLYNEDCLITMGNMEDKSVDLTLTSPPYDDLRTYNEHVGGNKTEFNGYSFPFENIARELFRITKKGGVVVWVVGDATNKGSETGTSFRQALYFKECGFDLYDTMIYQKTGTPFPQKTRYNQTFEYMFVFSKGKPNTFNPIMKKNATAGAVNATAGAADATAGAAAGATAAPRTNEETLSGINPDIELKFNGVNDSEGGTSQITQQQKGGVFVLNNTSLPRLLNHNSIKEATHVMLTAHLLLNVPATGGGAKSPSQAQAIANREQLSGVMNHELSARNEFANRANADRHVGGAIPVISDTEIFSPSLPIYIVLDGLREVIPRLNGHHDYDDYVTYYLLLESMNEQLKEHPLPLIGFALREILITFISTQVERIRQCLSK